VVCNRALMFLNIKVDSVKTLRARLQTTPSFGAKH
jgi:hypothetical protein